jgi:uncharacterized membrane protein
MKMKKSNLIQLPFIAIFGIFAVILYFFGDIVGGNMMAVVGIALSLNVIIRKVIHKDELKKDEMVKRISGMSSDISLLLSIISIGLLTIVLHFFPTLFNVFEVLAILIFVMMVSKITFQLYYTRMKDEIGF